jgi:hypothetical protein
MGGLQSETIEVINEIGKSGGYLMIMDKRGCSLFAKHH